MFSLNRISNLLCNITGFRISKMKYLHQLAGCGAIALGSLSGWGAPVKAALLPSLSCVEQYIPVALTPGAAATYEVYGELCSQPGVQNRTVQVLISGNTYNSSYWDFSYQPQNYSYVNALTQVGFATFNIDRIGIGKSSRPPAEEVTVESNAYVLHQVNQALRNGAVAETPFDKIMHVGHSFGSVVAIAAASQYGGIDGLMLTGFLHNISPEYVADATSALYPAPLDPILADKNLPAGYLTTVPGVRGQLFYTTTNTDPAVIAEDEATKDTLTVGEIATIFDALASNQSLQIKVPTLLAIGQYDYPFCPNRNCQDAAFVSAFESSWFAPEANLQTYVLPNGGHNINLDLNASDWFKVAREWSIRAVGPGPRPVANRSLTDSPSLRQSNATQSVPEPTATLGLLSTVLLGLLVGYRRQPQRERS